MLIQGLAGRSSNCPSCFMGTYAIDAGSTSLSVNQLLRTWIWIANVKPWRDPKGSKGFLSLPQEQAHARDVHREVLRLYQVCLSQASYFVAMNRSECISKQQRCNCFFFVLYCINSEYRRRSLLRLRNVCTWNILKLIRFCEYLDSWFSWNSWLG